jgi:hypothetical protein
MKQSSEAGVTGSMESPRINGPGQKVTRVTQTPITEAAFVDKVSARTNVATGWLPSMRLAKEGQPSAPTWHLSAVPIVLRVVLRRMASISCPSSSMFFSVLARVSPCLLTGESDADLTQSRVLTNDLPDRSPKLTLKMRGIQGLANCVALGIRKPTRNVNRQVKFIDQDRLSHVPSFLSRLIRF